MSEKNYNELHKKNEIIKILNSLNITQDASEAKNQSFHFHSSFSNVLKLFVAFCFKTFSLFIVVIIPFVIFYFN